MKQLLLIAATIAFALSGPAYSKPGKGHGQGNHHAKHGQHHNYMAYWGGSCPPGLAKKNNGCLPPGQAKKIYGVGQRYPGAYGYRWSYNQIPYDLRNQYGLNSDYRYYYGDGYLYRVNPKTMLIQQVVSAMMYR